MRMYYLFFLGLTVFLPAQPMGGKSDSESEPAYLYDSDQEEIADIEQNLAKIKKYVTVQAKVTSEEKKLVHIAQANMYLKRLQIATEEILVYWKFMELTGERQARGSSFYTEKFEHALNEANKAQEKYSTLEKLIAASNDTTQKQ